MKRSILFALSLCLLVGACGRGPADRDDPPSMPTETAPPVDPIARAVPAPVPVPDEPLLESASFSVAGRVAEIVVQPGDWVEAGQYVARLDLTETDRQREQHLAEYQEAEQKVEAARTAYLKLKQQAEAGAGNAEQMVEAEARFQEVAASRGQALRTLRETQADSQRGILYAPVRGEVVAVQTALGADVESQQAVIQIRPTPVP